MNEDDKYVQLWDERIMDLNGWFIESITEQPDSELMKMAKMVRDNQNGTYTTAIGALLTRWVLKYTKP